MKNKSISVLLALFLILGCFTGCTVEFPDDLADDVYASMTSSEGALDSSMQESSPEESSSTDTSQSDSSSAKSAASAKSSKAASSKGKYQTDPIPSGKPQPVEPENAKPDTSKTLYATLSIRCDTILNNMDMFNPDKLSVLPPDGTILSTKRVAFSPGDSVFDLLQRETKKRRIHMEFSMSPIFNSAYIEGIHNLYEFDCGEGSGWMYKVNNWFPNYGASRYQLKDGDVIEWIYTCALGKDIGGGFDDQKQ